MTPSEEMAARGQLITDYGEAKKRLITLEAEAERIGKKLQELSMLLIHNPDRVVFGGQSLTNEYLNCPLFDVTLMDAKQIPVLVQEIREKKAEIRRLQQKVSVLGVE